MCATAVVLAVFQAVIEAFQSSACLACALKHDIKG